MELLIKDPTHDYLSVVEVWNSRNALPEKLESYPIGKLSDTDMSDIKAVWQLSMLGKMPEKDVLSRLGEPIDDEDDPRAYHQEIEAVAFDVNSYLMEELFQ